jgi:hypothetical protein
MQRVVVEGLQKQEHREVQSKPQRTLSALVGVRLQMISPLAGRVPLVHGQVVQ